MAERTVSTLLRLDGEAQYKAALSQIRTETNNLKASVKLLDEQFRGQSNSMAALTAKQQALSSLNESASRKVALVKDQYQKAQEAIQKYAAQIEALKAKIAAEGDADGKLAKQLETAQMNLQKAQNSTEYYKGAVTKAEVEVAKINNQLKDNAKYMDEAKKSTTGTAASIDEYGKKVSVAKDKAQEFGVTGAEAFNKLAQSLIAAGLIRGVKELVDLFQQAAAAAIEYESAFAGVQKTVEATPEQFAAISDAIKKMSTEIPLTTTELAKIAEIAGQLGIATNNIGAVTEVAAALGVTTNMSSEQAITALSKLAIITGMAQDKFSNLGSSIVAVGNKSNATESEIADMAMGISSAGKQVGMTQAQIIGLSAALASVGLESQMGGTAISRTLVEMSLAAQTGSDDLQKFADVAGMSSEAFASLFNASAIDALNAFINGLATGGESAIKVLDEMGITEIRQRDAILRLANANGLLTDYVNLSSTAFAENTALTEKASARYETTESKIQLLKNAVNLLGVTIGDQLSPALREAIESGTNVIEKINEFLQQNPGAVQAITGFAAALATMAVALAGVSVAFNIVIPAVKAFATAIGAASAASVLGGIAIAGLVVGLIAAATASKESSQAFDEQAKASAEITDKIQQNKSAYDESLKSIEAQRRGTGALIDELEKLSNEYSGSSAEQTKMRSIVDQLNSSIDGLNLTFDVGTGKISANADAIRDMAQAQFDAAKQSADAQRYEQLIVDQADAAYAERVARDAFLSSGGNADPLEALRLRKNWTSARESLAGVNDELQDYIENAANGSEATQDMTTATDGTKDAFDNALESAQKLSDAYDTVKKSVDDAAEKVAGLTDKLNGTGKKSIDVIIKAQKSQSDFWTDYEENLNKAKELGLDEGLLSSLATPTEENAQLLDSIVKGSVDKIEELNEAYQDNADARAAFAEQSTQTQIEASGLVEQFTSDMETFVASMDQGTSAYIAGGSTMAGLINGLEEKLPTLYVIIAQIKAALATISGLKAETNPNIPKYNLGFATGLDYVPYDEFPARLHEGEAVLTKQEARSWRAMRDAVMSSTPSAESMVAYQRPMNARDVASAVSASIQGGNTYQYTNTNVFSVRDPSPSEIAREEKRAFRRLVNT